MPSLVNTLPDTAKTLMTPIPALVVSLFKNSPGKADQEIL